MMFTMLLMYTNICDTRVYGSVEKLVSMQRFNERDYKPKAPTTRPSSRVLLSPIEADSVVPATPPLALISSPSIEQVGMCILYTPHTSYHTHWSNTYTMHSIQHNIHIYFISIWAYDIVRGSE